MLFQAIVTLTRAPRSAGWSSLSFASSRPVFGPCLMKCSLQKSQSIAGAAIANAGRLRISPSASAIVAVLGSVGLVDGVESVRVALVERGGGSGVRAVPVRGGRPTGRRGGLTGSTGTSAESVSGETSTANYITALSISLAFSVLASFLLEAARQARQAPSRSRQRQTRQREPEQAQAVRTLPYAPARRSCPRR